MGITIILGAGASRAFTVCPYPLQSEMLEKMLHFAEKPPDRKIKDNFERYLPKQRLFLTYAIMRALNQTYQQFELGSIVNNEINRHFEDVTKVIYQNRYSLDKIFDLLAKQEVAEYESVTKAHWALTHAISFFMLQMFSLKDSEEHFDRAHIILNSLIEELLQSGQAVNVIDFNYDCLLERLRFEYEGSSKASFGWDIGRPRKVLADDFWADTISELITDGKFREPQDGENFSLRASLIKPHGDMCTFLMGKAGIYYRGVRHSQSTSALFPLKLTDITEADAFLRTSIMPPTESRRRHSSEFYDNELSRFKTALEKSLIFIIIGWSAKGSDEYYDDIFKKAFQNSNREVNVYIIDKMDTSERIKELFCNYCQIKSLQVDGFTGESSSKLREHLKAEISIS